MPKLRVHGFTISLDGYGAGLGQTLEHPFGAVPEPGLHPWLFATKFGREMIGEEGGDEAGLDNAAANAGVEGIGATIIGRNMFTTSRGPWTDDGWTGWWGPNPPYHHDTFVITHHEREPMPMEGGTTFHFVDGIEPALTRAFDSAGGQDVRVIGGVGTVRQYLHAGLIDDMHLVISPILIGVGERLFDDNAALPAGYEVVELTSSPAVVHAHIAKKG